jgi:flagellin-like protein
VRTARGQSEVIGSILLVAVIVVAVSTIGGILLSEIGSQEDPPSAVVEGSVTEANNGTVQFEHGGGDSAEASALTVLVANESGPQRAFPFTPGDIHGNGDNRFEQGERWTNSTILCKSPSCPVPVSDSERVRIALVHEPSGTLLFEGARSVE